MKRQKSATFAKQRINKYSNKYSNKKNYCKVKDLCHYTGKYRGVSHSNLKYSILKKDS